MGRRMPERLAHLEAQEDYVHLQNRGDEPADREQFLRDQTAYEMGQGEPVEGVEDL